MHYVNVAIIHTVTITSSNMTKINQFAICTHTCVKNGCLNGTTNSILWNRNTAAYRHACARRPHLDCNEDCPAFDFLGMGANINAVRLPSEEEYQEFLQRPIIVSDSMDIDEENRRSYSPASTTTQNVEISYLLSGAESNVPITDIRPFKIIFIPDPTLAIKQKSVATNDLAFVRAHIDEDEYNAIEHLTGSVHYIRKTKSKYNVVMQEWVSTQNSCKKFLQMLILI